MIGIGLGGFMDGFQKGQQIRDNKEDRERRKVLTERQDEEYNRAKVQRDEIDQINKDAKATFDGQVASGQSKPDDFDTFYSGYAIPKLKSTYLSQGDIEKADAVQKWGDTADAKKGARLFSSALMKAQTGDPGGAIADVMAMGKINGYLNHGYEVSGHENIMVDGKLTGYRLNMKTPDGKPVVQDITVGDLPKVIATFGNPEAAWNSQLAAKAATAKREQELQDYRTKKSIDKEFGTGDTKLRADAIKSLRTRMSGGLDGSEEAFDDLPDEKKEELIAQELELVTGQPGATGSAAPRPDPQPVRKVVMDKSTGQQVAAKPAEGDKPNPAKPEPKPAPKSAPPAKAAPTQGWKADALNMATAALAKGSDPKEVATQLRNYRIPQEEWPPELVKRLSSSSEIGLGQ